MGARNKKAFGSAKIKYESIAEIANFLSEQMDKCPLGEDMQLIRGINWDTLADYGITESNTPEEILQILQSKGSYVEKGYMSCCPNIDGELPGILTNKPIKLILNVKGTTGGLDLSNINSKEMEILLDKGLSFTTTNVEEKDGSIYIYMDQE